MPGFTVYGAGRRSSKAELERTFPGDLAVVRLRSDGELACEEWLSVQSRESAKTADAGALVLREDGGGRSLLTVTISSIDEEYIRIAPRSDSLRIMKSMSGAALVINGALAGMLMAVDSTGVGEVLQLDDIVRLTEPFFGGEPPKQGAGGTTEINALQSIVSRAVSARNGSNQGQASAVRALLDRGQDFTNADWRGLSLREADLRRGNFSGARLHLADLNGVTAGGAVLSRAGLRFASLDSARLEKAKFDSVYAPFATMRKVQLSGADLSWSNLFAADLRGADLRGANLRGAVMHLADLRGAMLDGADLSSAQLIGALLDSVSLLETRFDNTNVAGATATEFRLSRQQMSGVCRHAGWDVDDVGSWHFRVTARSQDVALRQQVSPIIETNGQITGLRNPSLPMCSSRLGLVDYGLYYFPLTLLTELDQEVVDNLRAEEKVRTRVRRVLDEPRSVLLPRVTILGDSVEYRGWIAAIQRRSQSKQPLNRPVLGSVVLYSWLRDSPAVHDSAVDWAQFAQDHFNDERGYRRPTASAVASQLSADFFFPDGARWVDIADDGTRLFRDWISGAARIPARVAVLSARFYGNGAKGAMVDQVLEQPDGVLNARVSTEIMSDLPVPGMFDQGRLTELSAQTEAIGVRSTLLDWGAPLREYSISIPQSVAAVGEMMILVELKILGMRRGLSKPRGQTLILDVVPMRATLSKNGSSLWTGPVRRLGS